MKSIAVCEAGSMSAMRSWVILRSKGASDSKSGNTFFSECESMRPPVMFFAPAKLPRSSTRVDLPAFASS